MKEDEMKIDVSLTTDMEAAETEWWSGKFD